MRKADIGLVHLAWETGLKPINTGKYFDLLCKQ